MAVCAFRARVGEHQIGVALAAADPFVHATQGELGLIVVKLRNIANRFPSRESVAVLAGGIQVAMRAASGRIVWLLRRSGAIHRRRLWRRSRGAQQKPDNHVHQQCRAQGISLVFLVSHEIHVAVAVAIGWPPRVAGKCAVREITKGESGICSPGRHPRSPDSCGGHAIHFPSYFFQPHASGRGVLNFPTVGLAKLEISCERSSTCPIRCRQTVSFGPTLGFKPPHATHTAEESKRRRASISRPVLRAFPSPRAAAARCSGAAPNRSDPYRESAARTPVLSCPVD